MPPRDLVKRVRQWLGLSPPHLLHGRFQVRNRIGKVVVRIGLRVWRLHD
jgi:hypothetical protein